MNSSKKALCTLLKVIGILLCVFGFCFEAVNSSVKFIILNVVLIILGAALFCISIKLDSKCIEILKEDEEPEIHPKCFVVDGDTEVEIKTPLSDWEECYLIAWQNGKDNKDEALL